MATRCVIAGMGSRLGSVVTPVEDIEIKFGKQAGAMRKRYGIEELHGLASNDELITMSAAAAADAMNAADLGLDEIDGLYGLNATPTAPTLLPTYVRVVGDALGIDNVPMVTVGAGCAGGVVALETARNRILADAEDGRKSSYLVLAGDDISKSIGSGDWDTSVLFSSGAVAMVVTSRDRAGYAIRKIGSKVIPSRDRLYSMKLANPQVTGKPEMFSMNGGEVFDFTSHEVLPAALELMGWDKFPDYLYIVPHQASGRKSLRTMAYQYGIDDERIYMAGIRYGNTVAASSLMGLKDVWGQHDNVLLLGFGADLMVAAAYLEKEF